MSVAPGAWYDFAAQMQGEQLRLAVGDSDLVQIATAPATIDAPDVPLVLGGTVVGNLDHVEIYDFTAVPLVSFENGSTTMDVAIDASGQADVSVFSRVAQGGPSYAFPDGSRSVVIRRYEAPDPSSVQNESATSVFAHDGAARIGKCLSALTDGESGGMHGLACDLVGAFTPFAAFQVVRDVYVKGKHLIEGKRDTATYVGAAVALVTLLLVAIPVFGRWVRGLREAQVAARETSVAVTLAEKQTQILAEVLDLGHSPTAQEGLIRIINGDNVALSNALVLLETGMKDGGRTWERLERLGSILGHESLIARLDAIATKFGRTPGTYSRIEAMIHALDRVGLQAGDELSEKTLEGIMHLMERAPKVEARRIYAIWQTAHAANPTLPRGEAFKNIFEWIAEGEAKGMANLAEGGWDKFLRAGGWPRRHS